MGIAFEGAKVGSLSQDLAVGQSQHGSSLPLEVRDAGIDRGTPGKQLEFATEAWVGIQRGAAVGTPLNDSAVRLPVPVMMIAMELPCDQPVCSTIS